MTASPAISVIMGAFNCATYLDQSIRSVVNQTLADWELVLIDDGSTDETPDIIRRWTAADSRIRTFRQPHTGRPAAARNRGIAEARSGIIAFLDADDLYQPEKLERVIRVLTRYADVGAVFHDYYYFADGSEPLQGLKYLEHDRFFERAGAVFVPTTLDDDVVYLGTPDLFKFMSCDSVGMHTSSVAVRRQVLQSIDQPPFDETLPHAEDIHLWLRVGLGTRVAALARSLSCYRYHPESWMIRKARGTLALGSYRVKSHSLKRLERLLSREEWPAYRDRVARYWNGIAYMCLVTGLLPQAREGFWHGLRTAPSPQLRWRALKGLLVSVLPRGLVRAYWRVRRSGEFEQRQPLAR